jgi:hypothetical protein
MNARNANLITLACRTGCREDVVRLLRVDDDDADPDRRIDIHVSDELPFRLACINGHREIVEILLGLGGDRYIDVHAVNEWAFRYTCFNGHLEVVEILLSLGGDRRVDVHVMDEWALRFACFGRVHKVVELLVRLEGDRRVDIHAMDNYAFRGASGNGSRATVELLLSLGGSRAIPGRALAKYGEKDVGKRVLIAEWASGGAAPRRGGEKHELWLALDRVTLAEVLRLQMRPW